MQITDREDYRRALHRLAELLNGGASAETNAEVAKLEGEVAKYVVKYGQPDVSPGGPTNNS